MAAARLSSSLLKQPLRVAIDCSLESTMSDKELHRLVTQFKLCSGLLSDGVCLHVTGLRSGGRLQHSLGTLWPSHTSHPFCMTETLHHEYFSPAHLIYLSPDSDNTLEAVEQDKVYVLGGVVDLTIIKRLTEYHASKAGLVTAKLPVHKYMERTKTASLCLPINQVLGMLLEVYSGRGWGQVLEEYLPKRKGFVLKSNQ